MTKQTKSPTMPAKTGAVEMADDRLDQVAGGSRTYEPLVIKKRIDKSTP